jgi:hypothetical protein
MSNEDDIRHAFSSCKSNLDTINSTIALVHNDVQSNRDAKGSTKMTVHCEEVSAASQQAQKDLARIDVHVLTQNERLDRVENDLRQLGVQFRDTNNELHNTNNELHSTRVELQTEIVQRKDFEKRYNAERQKSLLDDMAHRLADRFRQYLYNLLEGWFPDVNARKSHDKVMGLLSNDARKIRDKLIAQKFEWTDDDCWNEMLQMPTFQRIRSLYMGEDHLDDNEWRSLMEFKGERNSMTHPDKKSLDLEVLEANQYLDGDVKTAFCKILGSLKRHGEE